jgi:hypothetical protein
MNRRHKQRHSDELDTPARACAHEEPVQWLTPDWDWEKREEPDPEEIERLAAIDSRHPANKGRKWLLPCVEVNGEGRLLDEGIDPANIPDTAKGLTRARLRKKVRIADLKIDPVAPGFSIAALFGR